MKPLLLSFLLVLPLVNFAQRYASGEVRYLKYDGPDFVILKPNLDTIFCDKVTLKTHFGTYIPREVIYTDNGTEITIGERELMDKLQGFKFNGQIAERLPRNPKKPHKGDAFMYRTVEGRITVWCVGYDYVYISQNRNNNSRYKSMIIQVDDGPVFIPSRSNYKNYMYPLVKDCKEMEVPSFLIGWFEAMVQMAENFNETCGKD